MADNKLSWTELRRALAVRAGVSEKKANAFLNSFNTQLTEALKSDKQVKLNGLGTFKLQAIAPRKSVNVTTGEEILIEGYNKISFAPEAGVKELVEKGSGVRSETANAVGSESADAVGSEKDPIKKLGAQADEIVDILGELGQGPKGKDKGQKTKDKGQKTKDKGQRKKDKGQPEDVKVQQEEVSVQPIEPVETPQDTPKEPEEKKQEEKPKKKYHFLRDTLICVVILLMLLLAGYFFLRNELSQWIEDFANSKPNTEQVESVQPSDISNQPSDASAQPSEESLEEWTFDEILLTEKVTYGSRLAWIAKKHYGDKVYWPYLYAANKDRLTNPSKVGVGMPIRVPKLSAEQMDTTDVRFLRLREEAYGKLKGEK